MGITFKCPLPIYLCIFSHHLIDERLDLIAQVEDVGVIEGHVMAITSENNKMVLEDDSSVAVSGCGTLALDMEDLGLGCVAAHHRRLTVVEAHSTAHGLPLAHLLVILVEVGGVVVFNQERALHVITGGRVESNLSLVLETLRFLKKSQSVHWSDASLGRCLALLGSRVVAFETLLSDRSLVLEWGVEIGAHRAMSRRVSQLRIGEVWVKATRSCTTDGTTSDLWRVGRALNSEPLVARERV